MKNDVIWLVRKYARHAVKASFVGVEDADFTITLLLYVKGVSIVGL